MIQKIIKGEYWIIVDTETNEPHDMSFYETKKLAALTAKGWLKPSEYRITKVRLIEVE